MTGPAGAAGSVESDCIPVLHLVDAAGGAEHLWGKERAVLWLMRAQRASGEVDPRLATFAPNRLATEAEREGFSVTVLAERNSKLPRRSIRRLMAELKGPPVVLHTHGYKANVLWRLFGKRDMVLGVVSTCHGWVAHSLNLRLYNAIDRWTSGASHFVVVPDQSMRARLPRQARVEVIPNGIPDGPMPTLSERHQTRAAFGWDKTQFVAGMLGRISLEKGILELLEAARARPDIRWVAAGAGPLEDVLRAQAPPSLQYVGYVSAEEYLPALDVFIQPSRTEALSLSLLEAARAGLPIVATRVGGTEAALRHDKEAWLVPPLAPQELAAAVARFRDEPQTAARLGSAARRRFEEQLRIEAVHAAYYKLYLDIASNWFAVDRIGG